MTEDVIDFGPHERPEGASGRMRPAWLNRGVALPVAALGAALGAASLVGDWQTVHLPNEGPTSQTFSSPVTAAGSLASTYLVTLVLLVTASALALFGDSRVRGAARVAGLALAGTALALLGATTSLLTKTIEGADFRFYPNEAWADVDFQLGWGIYAALAGVFALGVALAFSRDTAPPVPSRQPGEEPEFTDDAMDLTVTVHPIAR